MCFLIGSKVQKSVITQNEQKGFGSEKKGLNQFQPNKMFSTNGAAISQKQRKNTWGRHEEGPRNDV